MAKQTNELATTGVGRLMWKYFLPAFVGVMANSLYNIVDRIFIGQGVGSIALSGVSVVFPVMVIIMGFGMLIGIGASVQISLFLGKNQKDKAEQVLGNSVWLILISSAVVTAIGFLIKNPMLELFGATDETMGYANEYLNIILAGVFFQMLGFSLNSMIRAEGSARIAMYSMLLSAGANILLDYLFIFHLNMGVKGAAYATIIAMFILCIWVLAHFRSRRSVIQLKQCGMKLDKEIVLAIIAIGMAPFIMQIAASIVQGVYNLQLIKYGGDVAVAAMGIVMSVIVFILMIVVALNMAAQPIIGYNYGAKAYDRVVKSVKIGIVAATIISVAGWALVLLFPGAIVKAFNGEDADLLRIGKQGLQIFMIMLPIVGFQIIISNYFQSIGKAKIATVLTLMRQVVFMLPAIFIFSNWFQLKGIWMAGPVSDTLSAVVVLIYTVIEWRRLKVKLAAS
ncbi:MATE family efflux transporter [Prolixibacteraceae bacterium JC049]|nr:MATE family efflux transporter [Prolixibacteraceae bacterium JC049]